LIFLAYPKTYLRKKFGKHAEGKMQVRILLKFKDLRDARAFSLVVMYMLRTDASSASKKVTITYQTVR